MYQYPYGNAQQLNLDWLMEQWQEVKQSIDGSLQGEIDRVEAAITDLLAARDAAVAAAGAANTSAGAAAASAQAAAADAATATAQAAAAAQERVNAAQAANNAQAYAGNAQTQAAAAQNAAGQAAASANQAAADASDAHDDSLAASGSAVSAAASAAGALQNFQLSDAARQAAQAAEQDAEAAATLLQPPATSADIGKALIVKTVGGGTVTAYELGESGGGGSPAILQTIENVQIASFDDGTNTPVQQLVVDIEPEQSGSGDPAPDNVRPITGWTETNIKSANGNLLTKRPVTSSSGITVVSQNDYSITLDGTASSTIGFSCAQLKILPFQKYTVHVKGASSTLYVNINAQNSDMSFNSIIGSASVDDYVLTFETNNTYEYIFIRPTINTGNSVTNTTIYFSIIAGEKEGEFVENSETTYSITFPTEAGTVYGGTLTNVGEEWKLKINKGKILLTKNDIYAVTPEGNNARVTVEADRLSIFTQYGNGVCNKAKFTTSWASCGSTTNGIALNVPASNQFIVNNSIGTTLEEIKDFIGDDGLEICADLITSIEYTLTESQAITLLDGINNVWADTGNIKLLQYYADSKKYIDEQDTLIKALIAPVLDDMIADTALTANDFRIVGNTLYKITASVAAGAALTPNTNCTATTIGAILKTLLT